jgi:hypothetical protein
VIGRNGLDPVATLSARRFLSSPAIYGDKPLDSGPALLLRGAEGGRPDFLRERPNRLARRSRLPLGSFGRRPRGVTDYRWVRLVAACAAVLVVVWGSRNDPGWLGRSLRRPGTSESGRGIGGNAFRGLEDSTPATRTFGRCPRGVTDYRWVRLVAACAAVLVVVWGSRNDPGWLGRSLRRPGTSESGRGIGGNAFRGLEDSTSATRTFGRCPRGVTDYRWVRLVAARAPAARCHEWPRSGDTGRRRGPPSSSGRTADRSRFSTRARTAAYLSHRPPSRRGLSRRHEYASLERGDERASCCGLLKQPIECTRSAGRAFVLRDSPVTVSSARSVPPRGVRRPGRCARG